MVDLKKNDENNDSKGEIITEDKSLNSGAGGSYYDTYDFGISRKILTSVSIIVILVLTTFVFGNMYKELFCRVFSSPVISETAPQVSNKTFHLTVSGKTENNVTGVYVMSFADEKNVSRSFEVSKELYDKYEVCNQADITVNYEKGIFVLDDTEIKEIK